jgi:hypothetical protein
MMYLALFLVSGIFDSDINMALTSNFIKSDTMSLESDQESGGTLHTVPAAHRTVSDHSKTRNVLKL